jgi:hypothetical protein
MPRDDNQHFKELAGACGFCGCLAPGTDER